MKIAIVGVTGLVGTKMLQVLEERNFPVSELIPVASEKSAGKNIRFRNNDYRIVSLPEAIDAAPDVALFSAGAAVSLQWAPKFAEAGSFVIDNSSAWRMIENIPLVVPEVNPHTITAENKIIANPNCSTIQLVVALAPLHKNFNIKRLVISTYQSVTGTGAKAVEQLMNERKNSNTSKIYPHQIDMNCIPQCDVFLDNGYTKEEMKMVNETRKILESPEIAITATAVRVPVIGGHSESVNVEFSKPVTTAQILKELSSASGVIVQDNPQQSLYPMPLTGNEKDEVFVGRIRQDHSQPNTFNLWIVSDNLRKGAATNAVQIAEILLQKKLIGESVKV